MPQSPGRAQRTAGGGARDAVLDTVRRAVAWVIPRLADRVKRVILGGRSITIEGNRLDTTLQLALAAQHASGFGGLIAAADVDVARRRLKAEATAATVDIPVPVSNITIPGPAGHIPVRHYRPADNTPGGVPLLVFYHGGGFVVGDLDTHDALCRFICRDGAVQVLSVGYRLAPEHPAPAAVEDAYAAYRWASDHATALGADPARVAVGGDSAGGNLAAVVSMLARDAGVRPPALQMLMYPIIDLRGQSRSRMLFADGLFLRAQDLAFCAEQYLAGTPLDATDPRVSPLLAGDLSGLPPALVLTAGFDPLRDEGNAYAAALRAAGTPVDAREYRSVIHAFGNYFPLGGDSAAATADLVSALRAHLSRARGR